MTLLEIVAVWCASGLLAIGVDLAWHWPEVRSEAREHGPLITATLAMLVLGPFAFAGVLAFHFFALHFSKGRK